MGMSSVGIKLLSFYQADGRCEWIQQGPTWLILQYFRYGFWADERNIAESHAIKANMAGVTKVVFRHADHVSGDLSACGVSRWCAVGLFHSLYKKGENMNIRGDNFTELSEVDIEAEQWLANQS